jgi:hypothetical protein
MYSADFIRSKHASTTNPLLVPHYVVESDAAFHFGRVLAKELNQEGIVDRLPSVGYIVKGNFDGIFILRRDGERLRAIW